jgi:hypothetical protein
VDLSGAGSCAIVKELAVALPIAGGAKVEERDLG